MPARAIDTATLSFGLVSIPVKVYSSGEPSHHLSFNMIHRDCGERVHQQYVCPKHGEVARADIAKGYEYAKGKYLQLTDEELDALEAVASDTIAFREFVPADAIDPLYVDHSYYLGPDKGGEAAYRLIAEAMKRSSLVGLASYAARGKQYVVMVRPYEEGLIMHQLRYPDEVKAWSEVPMPKLPRPKDAEIEMAQRIIEHITVEEFDPSKYKDEVKTKVKALLAKRVKGHDIPAPEPEKRGEVIDLMAALRASLGGKAHKATGAKAARSSSRAKPTKARASRASSTGARASKRTPRAARSSTTRRAARRP